jgi:hypothetical protein
MTPNPYQEVTVREAYINLIGIKKVPPVKLGDRLVLSDDDIQQIGEFTRESVQRFLLEKEKEQYQSILDFAAVCGDIVVNWLQEDSETFFQEQEA